MLLHFSASTLKFKQASLILLPIIWVAMFQIYIPVASFILTSFVFLLFIIKKNDFKYLLLGCLLSLILIIPSIKFYNENPIYLGRFFSAPKLFTPVEKKLSERIKNVTLSFIEIPVGGKFRWQTGSSDVDFIKGYVPWYQNLSKILTAIFVLSILYEFYIAIKQKDKKRGVVVAWTICSLWYLIFLWTSNLPPRYFLISFPPAMLLLAIFFNDLQSVFLKVFHKSGGIILVLPVSIIFYWVFFIFQYNTFVKNFNYPKGWFYDVSETSYLFIDGAIKWIINDSDDRKCYPIDSNDINNPNFGLWMEVEYPWRYVYKKSMSVPTVGINCNYLIIRDDKSDDIDHKKFGPFSVFRND
jgi:hypothetical protein